MEINEPWAYGANMLSQYFESTVYMGTDIKQYSDDTELPLDVVNALDLLSTYLVKLDLQNREVIWK